MKIFVGITGASGQRYGARLVRALAEADNRVSVCFSDGAVEVVRLEEFGDVERAASPSRDDVIRLFLERSGVNISNIELLGPLDFGSEHASGSALAEAAVVCPCSMSSLASIATGITRNLIHRTADVMLKESRRLIVVPRETPLSQIHLRNMLRLSRAGAVILPAMPAFYQGAVTVDDMVDFIAGKVLDSLGLQHDIYRRWQGGG